MDNNLTINSLALSFRFSDKSNGSERINVSAGANLPLKMTVKHQQYTDSATKLKGRRSLLRFDKTIDGLDGTLPVVSGYLVVTVPNHPAVTATHITDTVAMIEETIQADGAGVKLADEIFVNQEQ